MAKAAQKNQVGRLEFSSDKGAGRSKWIAGFFTLALIGWMGSGFIILPEDEPTDEAEKETQVKATTVAVVASDAQDVELLLTAEGQSEPDRSTIVATNAGGQVTKVFVNRGELVQSGQDIGRINATIAQAQLTQAEASFAQTSRDLENAIELQSRGLATEDRVSAARAAQASAQAALTTATDQFDNTIVRAPFSGRLNDLMLEVGEFLDAGDPAAEVVDNDPLTVVIQVPQQALSRLKIGQMAQVQFITGERLMGKVGFIGNNADAQTRTFRAEITVDNPDSTLPAGLSAKVAIPTGQTRGHFVSPAILSLGSDGTLGIKTVETENKVVFSPITIVRAQTDGIWVTGLPDQAQIITVGQGFVSAGDTVDPKTEDAIDEAAAQTAEAQ